MYRAITPLIIVLCFVLACCSTGNRSALDQYKDNLVSEGLQQQARLWETSSALALDNPIVIQLPYAERRILQQEHLFHATAFEVTLTKNQQLQVSLLPSRHSTAPLFVEIYQAGKNGKAPKRVESKPIEAEEVRYEADRAGRYIVLIQPAHLANGLVDIVLSSPPKFAFPVAGTNSKAILSFFGDPRESGKRKHHGVDVFGARGTPIQSVSEGKVTRTGTTGIGGNHIWIRDGGYTFYYAHLDTISIKRGDRVKPGDTIGTMGNSGNAQTTLPHLHFGIYERFRGPINPFPLIDNSGKDITTQIGGYPLSPKWVSVAATRLNVRAAPSTKADVLSQLKKNDLVKVFAVADTFLRVETGNGTHGYVARHLTKQPEIRQWQTDGHYALYVSPYPNAPLLATLDQGESVGTLGNFGHYQFIQLKTGLRAWARINASTTAL